MKMKRLRLMSILMAIMMVFTMMPMLSQVTYADSEMTIDGVRYSLHDDNTATVIGYTDELPANVIFPETVSGHTVTGIGNEAFDSYKGTLTSITIPKTVTSIGQYAFYGTGIASVSFDENSELTYIGISAFTGCVNLESITIPKTVTTIDAGVFSSSGLKTIIFEDESELTAISGFTFEYCVNLESITIPKTVTTIGTEAFSSSGLKTIIFEDESELTEIKNHAFKNCSSLTSITIPSSVTYIGNEVFNGCNGFNTVFYEGTEDQWNSMRRSPYWAKGWDGEVVFLDINSYDVSFDDKYLVLDDDPVTPYPEFFYDVPADTDLNPKVARGDTVLGSGCYKASYSEVYFNEEKYEYNIIDENVWQEEFPTKQGVYFCKVEGVSPYYGSFEWIPLIRVGKIDITDKKVELSKTSFVYNGKVQNPSIKTIDGKALIKGKNYTILWSNASSKNVGKYTATIIGKGIYAGTTKATYTIAQAANPLTIKAKTATVKGSTKGKNGKLKKTKTLAVSKVIAFTKNGQGKMTYTKASGNKKIVINKTTGKVTVKKGLKKGTYKVKVKVKAAGNTNYKASAWKTVTFKVKVK